MIPAIPSIGPIAPSAAVQPATQAANAPATAGGSSFGDILANAVDAMQGAQSAAQVQSAQVAAGSGNVTDAMISSTQAVLDAQLFVSLRNSATSAINQLLSTPS